MRALLGFGLAIVCVVQFAAAGDDKADSAKLLGTWTNEVDGSKHELKLSKDSFTFTVAGDDDKKVFKGTWKIDAAKKPNLSRILPPIPIQAGQRITSLNEHPSTCFYCKRSGWQNSSLSFPLSARLEVGWSRCRFAV